MLSTCQVCKLEFESSKPAKTCSPKCRVTLARLRVTESPNVTLAEPNVTRAVTFQFTIKQRPNDSMAPDKSKVREAIYWYDVPLAAVPKLKEGWPEMPDYMDGRQYFLWWKNEFKVEEDGTPIILNPFPQHENLRYEMGGEGSRRWGA